MTRDEVITNASDPKGVWYPYWEKGHDMEGLLKHELNYKCRRCGTYQIDLSEDMWYGEMRECKLLEPSS